MAFQNLPGLVQFNASTFGTGAFSVASAVAGCLTPAQANALNGQTYGYYAQSTDGSQWEKGFGVYSNGTLTRSKITWTSDQDQAAVNFRLAPVVAVFPQSDTALSPVPLFNYLTGCALGAAGSSTTFTVSAGQTADSTNVAMMAIQAMTKTALAWSVGNGGALDTGTIAINTWYHVHLIERLDTLATDIAVSLSATAPTFGSNIPSAYTLSRRIGSMKTDSSGNWIAFTQRGDDFLWSTPVQDVNNATWGTTPTLVTLSVPTGIQVLTNATFSSNPGETAYFAITSPDQNAVTPSVSYFDGFTLTSAQLTFNAPVRTNTSGQVRVQVNGNAGSCYVNTRGWTDRRGRL